MQYPENYDVNDVLDQCVRGWVSNLKVSDTNPKLYIHAETGRFISPEERELSATEEIENRGAESRHVLECLSVPFITEKSIGTYIREKDGNVTFAEEALPFASNGQHSYFYDPADVSISVDRAMEDGKVVA